MTPGSEPSVAPRVAPRRCCSSSPPSTAAGWKLSKVSRAVGLTVIDSVTCTACGSVKSKDAARSVPTTASRRTEAKPLSAATRW